MKYLKLITFLFVCCLITVKAQRISSLSYRISTYYLYSSEDKVFYKKNKKWEPVIYDETMLDRHTMVRSNAPFTVIQGKNLYFCSGTKKARELEELLIMGGKRNTSRVRTGVLASFAVMKNEKQYKKYNYLLYEMNDANKDVMYWSQEINEKVKVDTNSVLGYNKVLFDNNERTRESLLSSIKSMSVNFRGGVVLLYISANGIKDKYGKYHFIASDTKYDSLSCEYKNTIPVDTINTCLDKLNVMGSSVFVFINTNHPIDLIQDISQWKEGWVYVWTPNFGIENKSSLFDEVSSFESYDYIQHSTGNIHYFINRKE